MEGYSKNIVDFGSYNETEINAKVDNLMPLASAKEGIIGERRAN